MEHLTQNSNFISRGIAWKASNLTWPVISNFVIDWLCLCLTFLPLISLCGAFDLIGDSIPFRRVRQLAIHLSVNNYGHACAYKLSGNTESQRTSWFGLRVLAEMFMRILRQNLEICADPKLLFPIPRRRFLQRDVGQIPCKYIRDAWNSSSMQLLTAHALPYIFLPALAASQTGPSVFRNLIKRNVFLFLRDTVARLLNVSHL